MSELDSLKTRAFRGVFTLSFRRLILKVIDTLGTIILARALTQETFGIFAIVSFIVFTFLAFFSDVGLGAALIQKKEDLTDQDVRTTFTVQQLLVTALLIIAWVTSPWIASIYNLGNQGIWLIRVLSLSIFLTSFKTIPSILLERELKFGVLIIPEILETVVYNGIAVFMALSGYGVWSLVTAILARTVVGGIALNILKPWPIGWSLSRDAVKGLLNFGVPYQLNSLLALLKDNITPTVIAYFYGPIAVGYLNLAQNISSRPMEIITIVSRVTFPTYSRLQGDKARLKRWLEKSTHLMAILYFPAVAGLIVTSASLLQYLYADKTSKWLPALPALLWFLTSALPVIVTTTYTNALYALGHPKVVLKLMVLYTVLTWVIGLPLIKYVGFVGIAITIFLITYITFPLVVREMNKVVKVDTLSSVLRPMLASLVMASLVYVADYYFVSSLASLFIAIFVGAIVYVALIYALDGKFLRAEIKNILTHSLKRG